MIRIQFTLLLSLLTIATVYIEPVVSNRHITRSSSQLSGSQLGPPTAVNTVALHNPQPVVRNLLSLSHEVLRGPYNQSYFYSSINTIGAAGIVASAAGPIAPANTSSTVSTQTLLSEDLSRLLPAQNSTFTSENSITMTDWVASGSYNDPAMASDDIFADPISTKPPPATIETRKDHPVPRKGITAKVPLQTNKFYSNFFLSEQHDPTYTFPFSIAWAGGKGASGSWGMSCSHIEARQRVFGKEKLSGASSYFINPIGIQSMVLSAKELGKDTALTIDAITAFSARVYLSKDEDTSPAVSFPIVQGMAYITAQYNGSVPLIQSGVFFKTVTKATKNPKGGVIKYTFNLEDGSIWRLYAWSTEGGELDLEVLSNSRAEAKNPFHGIIQVCKDPGTPESEEILDDGAGVYPVTMKLSGSVTGDKGTYRFRFQREGHGSGHLYMYALPHHVDSFAEETKKRMRKFELQSTTKGLATLVIGSEWIMVEPRLPVGMGFAPWHPEKGAMAHLSHHAKSTIRAAAARELEQNMIAQSNLDSMYFSGKVVMTKILLIIANFPRPWQSLQRYCMLSMTCLMIKDWPRVV
jgi:endoglucanase Acf2